MDEKRREKRAKDRLICHTENVNRSIALYIWRVRGKEKKNSELSSIDACASHIVLFDGFLTF
jgi:hypothetical protein